MHWQSRSLMRERDHRISLMPILPERPAGEPSLIVGTGLLVFIAAIAWFAISVYS